MIVYGDRERREPTSALLERLSMRLTEVARAHGATGEGLRAELAIESGVLAQGLLDLQHARDEQDEQTALTDACAALCLASARAFLGAALAPVGDALQRLRACAPEETLKLRDPEGYAFYALYPDLYVAAARSLASEDVQVIGIRSIGTSLAAFVAAAAGSTRLPFSLRPVGHPFARTVRVGERLARTLLERTETTRYLVVDEGPGLSGSSFVAITEWLLAHGVDAARITLFPSHAGEPGAQAGEEVKTRYRTTARRHVPFEEVFPPPVLGAWFEDAVGASDTVRDLSGGRWRALQYGAADPLPPSHVRDERRKYLLERDQQRWLMKFVGLGESGRRIATRARVLGEAGLTPAIRAARHGFLLMAWERDATPLPLASYDRAAFVDHLGRYLAFVATRFGTAPPESGARPEALLALLEYNAAQLLGDEPTRSLARFDASLAQLGARHRPTATDNKLDAHEWLVRADGTFVKCDAEGHHAAHDCIGCQDPAWDVAGACIEHALTADEQASVLRRLQDDAALRIDADALTFYQLAYAAFRAGSAHYAELALAGWAEDDAMRFRAEKARYTAIIRARL